MSKLTHLDKDGYVRMVDVTDKHPSERIARAGGRISMSPETFVHISKGEIEKGNVLETARIAGVMAAKKTSELIPMCHPLALTHVVLDFIPDPGASAIDIEASVRVVAQTGVEMEALCAVSTAALTIYDMCKAVDKTMVITDICLLEKSGGKSGTFKREGRPRA